MDQRFPDYRLTAFQAQHGPKARHILCASTLDGLSLDELLRLASDEQRELWQRLSLGYASERGDVALRQVISESYPGLDADNIVIFAGAQEATFCAFHALLQRGDKVVGIEPWFEPLSQLPLSLGADYRSVALKPGNNGWQLDCNEFVAAMAEPCQLAVVNFPHNPTGALISREQYAEIVEAAQRQGSWLFADEVFRGLEYDAACRLPPAATLYERAVSLGSIAKPFALGGVRVGWLASRNQEFLQRCVEIKRSLSICTGRSDEVLALIAFSHGEPIIARNLDIIRRHLTGLELAIEELAVGLRWIAPQAGCMAFPQLRGEEGDAFAMRLLRESAVLVLPGEFFGGDAYRKHFRLGFGRGDFNAGFAALKAALRAAIA